MTVTASQIFSFIEQHPTCLIDKREVHLNVFGVLRRSVRQIVVRFNEEGDEESQEIAERFRRFLSEWLTVPVPFDGTMASSLSTLGDPKAIEMRWGWEIRRAYDTARAAAELLQEVENPIRTEIYEAARELTAASSKWKIYCHRRARSHFESIFMGTPVAPDTFLHSVKDYRETAPFDVLIKVGPLRSRGWGSAPDAVLSAPRFGKMIQMVWSGCNDEDDFGYDPASIIAAGAGTFRAPGAVDNGAARDGRWQREVINIGDTPAIGSSITDDDELRIFHDLERTAEEVRRATLVEIDEEDGILYPPHAQVPTFDPKADADEPIGYRLPGETLAEGMFIIWPLLGAADLGGPRAGEGSYSRIWKERLREEMSRGPKDFMRRVRAAGIDLRNLQGCIRQWCRPPSTVIHAPQQRRHFEMLIGVLGINHDATATVHTMRRPWWEYAWSEIGRTRGEAIQTGLQEHEIVYEQLFVILKALLREIRERAAAGPIFEVEIPPGADLTGAIRFYRVRAIEGGYSVPENMLKIISSLDIVEQWRA